jgi:hypothetical protein
LLQDTQRFAWSTELQQKERLVSEQAHSAVNAGVSREQLLGYSKQLLI